MLFRSKVRFRRSWILKPSGAWLQRGQISCSRSTRPLRTACVCSWMTWRTGCDSMRASKAMGFEFGTEGRARALRSTSCNSSSRPHSLLGSAACYKLRPPGRILVHRTPSRTTKAGSRAVGLRKNVAGSTRDQRGVAGSNNPGLPALLGVR